MQVRRLGKEHYNQIVEIINQVFTLKNGKEMDIERELPKMCVRDEQSMRKHFGILENGELVACLGVYPFSVTVANNVLTFATLGNVVTRPEYEGKGYMSELLDAAVKEMDDLNVDVARLAGLRSRYNRYGFEVAGQRYVFTFTGKNRLKNFPDFKGGIVFEKITPNDKSALEFAAALYNKNGIAAPRTLENAYVTMCAWRNTPYIAKRNGKAIGYLVAGEDGTVLAEQFAVDIESFKDMLCGWQKNIGKDVVIAFLPHQIETIRVFSAVCERSRIESPSHFYVRNWDKAVNAFIKLKAGYCKLPKGEKVIEIEGYGAILIRVDEFGASCEKTDRKPSLVLDRLAATRYIFGLFPPTATCEADELAQAWFPLPLGWDLQDRV